MNGLPVGTEVINVVLNLTGKVREELANEFCVEVAGAERLVLWKKNSTRSLRTHLAIVSEVAFHAAVTRTTNRMFIRASN